MPKTKNLVISGLTLACLLAGINLAIACTVPVFRFALERWPADPYDVYVYYDGELNAAERELLTPLRQADQSEGTGGNVRLHLVDINGSELNGPVEDLWQQQAEPQTPWIVARSPRTAPNVATVFAGPLEKGRVKTLLDSPARTEVAERILAGQSTVWVLLESGDAEKDREALETLSEHLERLTEELRIPVQSPESIAASDPESPPLRVEFSILQVSRDDPKEEAFVSMLVATEDDLHEFEDQPLAFPICGRGRTIYALVGAGINGGTIREACEFLIGPCSCQVKEQNPGVDLLMNIQWGELVEESLIHERELPPLAGLDRFVEVAKVGEAAERDTQRVEDKKITSITGGSQDRTAKDDDDRHHHNPSSIDTETTLDVAHSVETVVHEANSASDKPTPRGNPLRRNLLLVLAIAVIVILGGGAMMFKRPD